MGDVLTEKVLRDLVQRAVQRAMHGRHLVAQGRFSSPGAPSGRRWARPADAGQAVRFCGAGSG
jgi:hypothetical protein